MSKDTCPFCGLDPYEYVDTGIASVPIAVNCCSGGIALYRDGMTYDEVKAAREAELSYKKEPHAVRNHNCTNAYQLDEMCEPCDICGGVSQNTFFNFWTHCPFCLQKLDEWRDEYDHARYGADCINDDCCSGYQWENELDYAGFKFCGYGYEFPDFLVKDAQYVNMRIYQLGGRPSWIDYKQWAEPIESVVQFDDIPF